MFKNCMMYFLNEYTTLSNSKLYKHVIGYNNRNLNCFLNNFLYWRKNIFMCWIPFWRKLHCCKTFLVRNCNSLKFNDLNLDRDLVGPERLLCCIPWRDGKRCRCRSQESWQPRIDLSKALLEHALLKKRREKQVQISSMKSSSSSFPSPSQKSWVFSEHRCLW